MVHNEPLLGPANGRSSPLAFNALDKESVRVLKEWLIEAKSNNKLVILTSHSQVDISTLCNSVFFVDSGKVEKEL